MALAQIFITTEEKLYTETAAKPGGWRGKREFIVDSVEHNTPTLHSLLLRPEDGKQILAFV